MITFRQLKQLIEAMPEERQEDTATVYDESIDEYYAVENVVIASEDAPLDDGHHVITLYDGIEVK